MEDLNNEAEHGPIPPDLHSFLTGGPFRTCTVCGCGLTNAGLYEIQKVYRGSEVVFEMALCQTCSEGLSREFSKESIDALKGFLVSSFQPSPETRQCHFCAFPRALANGYTLVGACRAETLLLPLIVLCDTCGEKLQSLLSKKTRACQDDFIQNNFPGVPADVDFSPTLGVV
jgi:hypothetical protein